MILDNDPLGIRSVDIKYEGSTRATQYCIDDFMKLEFSSPNNIFIYQKKLYYIQITYNQFYD